MLNLHPSLNHSKQHILDASISNIKIENNEFPTVKPSQEEDSLQKSR